MKKIIMLLICLIGVNSGARSQAPDFARTPEAKKLVDEYINVGGKNIQDINDMLEEPYGDYTPMLRLADKNDALSIPLIIYTLRKYDDATVKKDCIEALVKLKDNRAVPVLRELLDNKDWDVRLSAANALMGFNKNDPQALQAVKTIFFECPDGYIRAGALGGISQWEPHKMQYLVQAATEDKSAHTRIMSAALIGGHFNEDSRFVVSKDIVARELSLTLLLNWLKNISPQENHQDVSYVFIHLLPEFLSYAYDNRLIISSLEKVPNNFKGDAYKALVEKLKSK